MKPISTRTHGVLDYVMGAILIVAPFLLGFADGGPAMWVPVILGLSAIVYSMLTNYELGLVGALSMRTHLALDFASGAILAASPWLFGFDAWVWVPHLVLGIAEVGASLLTQRVPSHGPGHRHTVITHHP